MAQTNLEKIDPEMLKNLDLLLHLDILEEEENWDDISELETTTEKGEDDET